jgi:hypothetical protein
LYKTFIYTDYSRDRLCGLVFRVPGYRSRGPGFGSRYYQIFWEVVCLERGPLSLVGIIEGLLEWKSSGSSQENRINGREDPLRWPRNTLYPRKLALTSPTSGGRSVGIVRLRTKGHGEENGLLAFEIFSRYCVSCRANCSCMWCWDKRRWALPCKRVSTTLLASAPRHQHLHVECVVNIGPFWYRYKVSRERIWSCTFTSVTADSP